MKWPSPEEIASWPAPNYVNPETRGSLVLGVNVTFSTLVVLFITVRFYSRVFMVKALGVDDWVMLVAAIASIATSIMMCVSTAPRFLTGYHIWDLTPSFARNPSPGGQIGMASQLMFITTTMLMKMSVLLTYLRVFPSRTNKWFCYILMTCTMVMFIVTFFLALFQCIPIQAYWRPFEYPHVHCLSITVIYWSTGVPNIISDLLIFLWPAKDLANLKLPLKERVILISMFCLGIIICIAGICRLWYTVIYVESFDIFYEVAAIYAIITIETSLGIICGSIPACKPLLSRLFPRFFAPSASSPQIHCYQDFNQPSPSILSRFKRKRKKSEDDDLFPITSLSGGEIVRQQSFSVEYEQRATRESKEGGMLSATHEWVGGDGEAVMEVREGSVDADEVVLLGAEGKGKSGVRDV
ncbi:hypothetical protein DM02DRAFT_540645 [Periconia macrospinosa]|uniref:Rhodopsin domain-containing protein n=1 Tax=Periconia macrospinosa TaxID=97972 RepID=A0A2V1D733_9PLEO|nr:hypothetical protein DM02DRAFT_540645 [Periconia macrospinosa]